MAIDAKIVGVRIVDEYARLTIEPRVSGTSAGQSSLTIDNSAEERQHVEDLIGCEVWGNASQLMLRNAKLANRIGYTTINLVPHWRELVKAYK